MEGSIGPRDQDVSVWEWRGCLFSLSRWSFLLEQSDFFSSANVNRHQAVFGLFGFFLFPSWPMGKEVKVLLNCKSLRAKTTSLISLGPVFNRAKHKPSQYRRWWW